VKILPLWCIHQWLTWLTIVLGATHGGCLEATAGHIHSDDFMVVDLWIFPGGDAPTTHRAGSAPATELG